MATEKRVLKLTATQIGRDYRVQVTEQSHRNGDFTPEGCEWKASNGETLHSCARPAKMSDGTGIFVRGDNRCSDGETFLVSAAAWKRIRAAVAEYNATFKGTIKGRTIDYAELATKVSELRASGMKGQRTIARRIFETDTAKTSEATIYAAVRRLDRRQFVTA